ncbi:MFS transporter [Glaciimonas soli]|uniref:MFS transporter n=1 Tax=Glaciimonas soli TaxID=2590999 RepID=A0A843YMQ0_9BURK|nr:MFS transporter [Glaciimonas soli]MQR00200.1 MFS transporter [Glaciimonas soli]
MKHPATANLSEVIDSQHISAFQFRIFCLCFLCLLADGFDAQALGYVVPAIGKSWGISPAAFAPAFSAGLIGMAIGAIGLGSLADYIGRRKIIILCMAMIGVCTMSMASVDTMNELIMLRVLAGLALGGLLPNIFALGSEYSPTRRRAMTVMIISCGISLGSALGGVTAGALLQSRGWPIIFQIGGTMPLVLALMMLIWLPESISYQAIRDVSRQKLVHLMAKICPHLEFSPDTRFVVIEQRAPGLTVKHLFAEGRAFATILIWVVYFMCLLEIYFFASWLPTLLHKSGISLEMSVYATSALQIAGTVASLTLGIVLERFNPGFVLALLYMLGTIAIFGVGASLENPILLIIATSFAGAGIIGGQACTHAIASRIYPTSMRSTGIGWGLGIGRIGSVIGPIIGGVLLSLNWSADHMLYAGAVPALLAALAAAGLSFTFSRFGRSGKIATQRIEKQPTEFTESVSTSTRH